MAEISKIQLPSGNTYDIKDATARQMISGGVSFIIAWDGTSTPTVANIPAGVVVTYNSTDYTGTLAADSAEAGAFYLVKSSTQKGGSLDVYDEYVPVGTTGSKTWEKIGDTQVDLSDVVTGVTLNKQTTSVVTGYASPSTDTFVKSVSAETNKKLVTTTVPNVTSAGSASTWGFAMGTGDASETLIITGANGSAPTLGTAITVATGGTDANGAGDSIVTGVTIGSSASAITALGTASTDTVLNNSTSLTVTKGNA